MGDKSQFLPPVFIRIAQSKDIEYVEKYVVIEGMDM
jgi:hypothetical protein